MVTKKTNKYHWYPNNSPPGRKRGYPKTACGCDGSDVGGLITGFFEEKAPNTCKICIKKYKECLNNVTT